MSFDQVLAESEDKVRHLLLGNGFSIAADETFSYSSLFEVAFAEGASHLKKVFARLETTDFEVVSRRLGQALEVAECYEGGEALAERIRHDLKQLRERLIRGLTVIHPATRRVVDKKAYEAVGKFLRHFRGRSRPELAGDLYTTNYDLLLYWAVLDARAHLAPNDGFGNGELTWRPDVDEQCVFFLHGALHLDEDENRVTTKMKYVDSSLIEQISEKVAKGKLPLFVSEGTSAQKIDRIQRSPYLSYALERFEKACYVGDAHLFVFGHSLGDEDQHIVDAIREGDVARVCISARNVDRVRVRYSELEAGWRESRRARKAKPVEIVVFPADQAKVWG
jgi:hypothetical protein